VFILNEPFPGDSAFTTGMALKYGRNMEKINFSSIKNQFCAGFHFIAEKIGKLGNRVIRFLKKLTEGIKQRDLCFAVATVTVVNILFLELAMRISSKASRLFADLLLKTETKYIKLIRDIVNLGCFVSLMIGINFLLSKGFQPTLKCATTTEIAVSACTSYILFQIIFN
jgi:hypothetical protein